MTDTGVLAAKIEMLHSDFGEIKLTLAELSKAITKLALVEERQAQTAEAMERAFKAIGKIEDRITALEQSQPKTKETSLWVDRFILGIVIAVMSFAGTKIGLM
jgi:hypothetical protein